MERAFQMPGPAKSFEREEALALATQVFWEQGYDGTSVGDLLDRMGLSRSSMYATFGDKKALFIETLENWSDEALASFAAALAGPEPIHDRLLRAFAEKERLSREHGNVGCFFGNTVAEGGMNDPDIAKVLRRFMTRFERILIGAFDDAIARGQMPKRTDTKKLALFVVTYSQGAAIMAKGRPNCFEDLGPLLMRVLETDAFER